MEIIFLICKIIEFNSILLYNFLCANKNLNNNIFKNITILNLLKNTKIKNKNLKKFYNIRILNLKYNNNITDDGLKFLLNLRILNLNNDRNITDEGLILKNNSVVF